MAEGDIREIEEIVKPCGLYRMKADNIKEASAMLVRDFGGVLPDTMDELLLFPGVGRKIANLILGDVFGKGGIVADTHCIRITGRFGFVTSTNQTVVERELDKIVPKEMQTDFCHRIVLFGRDCCTARNPKCDECPLTMYCREFNP
jgi:endonuclease-3